MVDLIDRQDLLKNLNRFAPEKYDALVNDIIKKQPTIEVKPQWIPCSERLPEVIHFYYDAEPFSDGVLVWVRNQYLSERMAIGTYSTMGWDFEGLDNRFRWTAVAWQPLPEPYRGGGKE